LSPGRDKSRPYNAFMFRLTREVRFGINPGGEPQLALKPSNSFGGFPTLTTLGRYYTLRITLAGELDARTSYLRNIKEIDEVVRSAAIPIVSQSPFAASDIATTLFRELRNAWPGAAVDAISLQLTPTLCVSQLAREYPMKTRLSQKFEFSASHRLHSPALSEEENRKSFGKCNNAAGHGHNYELQVTVSGEPKSDELLARLPELERIVAETVVERFDHKNLNAEVEEFATVIPTVENIARVIYQLLKSPLRRGNSELASVTVWETPKT